MIISIDFILLIKTRTLFKFFVHQSKHGNKPEILYMLSIEIITLNLNDFIPCSFCLDVAIENTFIIYHLHVFIN